MHPYHNQNQKKKNNLERERERGREDEGRTSSLPTGGHQQSKMTETGERNRDTIDISKDGGTERHRPINFIDGRCPEASRLRATTIIERNLIG